MDKTFTPHEKQKLITRAQKQFKSFMDWEGDFRESFEDDVEFANGDPDNQNQWEDTVLTSRGNEAPSMTINMTMNHCLLVQNDIKKNPPAIMVRATGGGSTAKSAEVFGGLIREISRASDATNIYLKASEPMIQGGVGYWRVLTEYEDEKSFDQVIRIRSIRNAMGVAMDTDAKEPSGADANWAMIFEDKKNDELEEEYEKYKDQLGMSNAVQQTQADANWQNEDHTRVAEWYERQKFEDQLLGFTNEQGKLVTAFLSDLPTEIRQKLLADSSTQQRPLIRTKIVWYKIFGNEIVDYREVPGKKYIPIVRIVGQETIVKGKLDRKGIVRPLKDAQRNMNYWVSAGAMQVALQTNVPWVGEAQAFENINAWASANTSRAAYLPYNGWDAQNTRPIPAPTRPQPPVMAQAYISGIQIASQQFKDISGQRDATLGAPGQEVSGVAIDSRKIQGETSTYHFPNALAQGVAHTGRIIIDMVPEVYDTPRLIRISNVDMSQTDVQVDPQAAQAHQEADKPDEENATNATWNPRIGRYEVEAEAGPDYATQREWTVDTMGKILSQNKELWTVVGDLFVENMDFPGAEEMAERIRRTMNPATLGKGPGPNEQKLQQQIQQGQKLMQSLMETIAQKQKALDDKTEELRIKQEDVDVKLGNAMTSRIKEVGNAQSNFAAAGLEPDIKAIMGQATVEALSEPLASALKEPEPSEPAPAQ